MNLIVQILAISWFACLFVQAWKHALWRTKHLKSLKPFACNECMGFWIGAIFFCKYPIIDLFILSSMSSLCAVLLYHIAGIMGSKNSSI